ncbi:Phosphotyrosyl phosphatase activator [Jaminaea rosea]|uniref:Serine/threonine-protein phosphatase 2A activator n=1 Tax=Jaminaea rosea TaxID=1569628 RepID=A0A316UJI0_9BASI|nr:Phosphotyrosyl phosphatase activator [Jaminaea rosea]PWN25437.1 Phosphotyrosyl phosphatase activator [Jaminaea rosea]
MIAQESARNLLAEKLKAPGPTSPPTQAALPAQQQAQQGTPQPPLPHYDPPVPLASSSSSAPSAHTFIAPRKRIISPRSLSRFQSSQSFSDIMGLVMALNEAVKGKTLTEQVDISDATTQILSILDSVEELVHETPPVSNAASRFGNPAFRDFADKLRDHSSEWHQRITALPTEAVTEVSVYFNESWGNRERIDYGSGMELNFLLWLLCLIRLSVLTLPVDGPAMVLRLFWRYIGVMRLIQSTYWLEPAGSHGVWGLDDYHFLPFVWGSSQLSTHRHLRPKSIHDAEILDEFSGEYMYLACIQFINGIKTASLRWHSPMLDDISGVKGGWAKVNEGMGKMYRAEVLSKLPIAQHIYFGSLLPFPEAGPGEEEEEEEDHEAAVDAHGHIHAVPDGEGGGGQGQAAGWGDCCGIPIPSAFGAAQAEREKREKEGGGGSGLSGLALPGSKGIRRVPFD